MTLEMKHASDIPGWMNDEELAWLSSQAARMQNVAEIGCWKGRSTFALLSACEGFVYAIDHFQGSPDPVDKGPKLGRDPDVRSQFITNCGHFPNLRLIEAASALAADLFTARELDMVFIDGSHRYEDVLLDIKRWEPKTRVLLSGHDFDVWPGVTQAVTESLFPDVQRGPGSIWFVEVRG